MELAALEAAVRCDLSNPQPRLVLGDRLMQSGDPAGELVVLQHGMLSDARRRKRAEAHLAAERERLLGALPADGVKLDWFCGSIRAVTLAYRLPAEQRLAALALLPTLTVGRFIEELTLEGEAAGELRALSFPCLRKLIVRGSEPEQWPLLDLPELTDVEVVSIDAQPLYALGGSRLPKLRSISTWLDGPAKIDDWRPLLERRESLDALRIDLSDKLCDWLVQLPFAKTLKRLTLGAGTLTLAGARTLSRSGMKLERLDTSEQPLDPKAKPLLAKLAQRAVLVAGDVDEVLASRHRDEGWLVLDRGGVDVDLALRSATLLCKHHSVRELYVEHAELTLAGRPVTVLQLRGYSHEPKLDAFAESLARRTETLPRPQKFKVLCLYLGQARAAYRLYGAEGLQREAVGNDDEVLCQGLERLLEAEIPLGYVELLRREGKLHGLLDAAQKSVLPRYPVLASVSIDFDAAAAAGDADVVESQGLCITCGTTDGEIYSCDDCGEDVCEGCVQQPERREAFVCRDCAGA